MIRRQKKGFTLIEIAIALAILAVSLAILINGQGSAGWMITHTNNIRIATLLSEEKMAEAQLLLEQEGRKDSDIEENGDFGDFGSEDWRQTNLQIDEDLERFKWAYTIRRIEMDFPSQLGSLTEDLGASGYFGDQNNEDVQNNTMDLGDLGISPDMITEYLSNYIREVRVRIWWGEEPDGDDQLEILTHIINPTGVVTESGDQETN